MKFSVTNDALVDIYDEHPSLSEDEIELFELTLQTKSVSINPAYFVRQIPVENLYQTVFSSAADHEILAAPIGARNYLEVLREKMAVHPQDHSRSIAVLDRLIPQTKSTLDNINDGILGVYLRDKPNNSRPLSLDDVNVCATTLENFFKPDYQPAILKLLGRFEVEWPTPEIDVEAPYLGAEDELDETFEHHSP